MKLKRLVPGVALTAAAVFCLAAGSATARTGQLDPTFGDGGVASPVLGTGDSQVPVDSVRQPDGSFVVVGYSLPGPGALIARLNPDGTPDSGFGTDGAIETSDVAGWDAVALQPDGRIVVAGHSGTDGVIARFNPDGTPDTGYGTSGRFSFDGSALKAPGDSTPIEVRVAALELLSGGRIRLAGRFSTCESYTCSNKMMAGTTATGTPDTDLGPNGARRLDLWGVDAIFAIDDSGRAVGIAEEWNDDPDTHRRTVAKFGPDGELISAITTWVVTNLPIDGTRFHATFDSQGRILVARGYTAFRLNPDGSLDRSFGRDGYWRNRGGLTNFTPFVRPDSDIEVTDVGLDSEGRILLAAKVGAAAGTSGAVIRLRPNGALDPTFGAGGMTVAWLGARTDQAFTGRTRLLVDDAGSVTLTGLGPHDDDFGFKLARAINGEAPWPRCAGRRADFIGTARGEVVNDAYGAVIYSGGGNDRITGFSLTVCSGTGDDVIGLSGGRNTVFSGRGDDRVITGGMPDRIFTGPGDDHARGGGGNDLIRGGAGRDHLYGGIRDDRLYGGAGDDRLHGEQGFDRLVGGPGRDRLRGGPTGNRFSDYLFRSPRLRILLVRQGRKVTVHRRVLQRCWSSETNRTSWSRYGGVTRPRLRPGGRFDRRDSADYAGDSFWKDGITGRLVGPVARGRLFSVSYFESDYGSEACSTGPKAFSPPKRSWVQFHARMKPRPRQVVRQ